jgi:hypothetical protein
MPLVTTWLEKNIVESHAFGDVSSTGEFKVLRVSRLGIYGTQVCEVITLDGMKHGRWRKK